VWCCKSVAESSNTAFSMYKHNTSSRHHTDLLQWRILDVKNNTSHLSPIQPDPAPKTSKRQCRSEAGLGDPHGGLLKLEHACILRACGIRYVCKVGQVVRFGNQDLTRPTFRFYILAIGMTKVLHTTGQNYHVNYHVTVTTVRVHFYVIRSFIHSFRSNFTRHCSCSPSY